MAHRLSCSAACGIFPDQGSNPCPLRLQADSQPLRHQGSPVFFFKLKKKFFFWLCCAACGILVLRPGNKPGPLAVKVPSPNHWTTREFPALFYYVHNSFYYLKLFLCCKISVRGFPGGAVVKNPPAYAGDMGSSPGPGRSHMPQSN